MLNRAITAVAIAFLMLMGWAFSAAHHTPWPTRSSIATSTSARSTPAAAHRARASTRLHRRPHHRRLLVDRRAAAPTRIQISAIGVSARVIPLGLNPDGTIQTPTVWGETGWYKPGPEPGERGPAVVVGHVDSTTAPAVFFRLRALKRGNLIRIHRGDHSTVRFRVQRVERWPKADFPSRRVYGPSRGSVLRLVTCSGNFDSSTGHYVDNTIVYASRV